MQSHHTANRVPIPILTYHQIAPSPDRGAGFRSLYVAPAAFARQMACLHLLGYQGLSMSALMPYLRGERVGRVVGISFDDGYLNNLSQAMPVLNRYGFSSTCYVVSQYLGKTNEWDRLAGIAPTPLMNAGQLREWTQGGQEVGAHTRHHVHLTQTDASVCNDEIGLCKVELEAVIDAPVRHFCYPYGEFNAEHLAQVRSAGFDSATTTLRSRCHGNEDMMHLPRVPVLRATTLPLFWLKLSTAYEDRRRMS
ncbi:MAG: polysaccharide deacetylase family protein [Comamonadaceae bacterium]|jgi:peptidoglycan/xylan/chitin deacetylase (PgdA/CDA1 family)